MASTGNRNCQTETPAARAITSSRLRVIFAKVTMPPTRTMKGSAFWAMKGMWSDAIWRTISSVAVLSGPDARRSSSIVSAMRIVIMTSRNTSATLCRYCLPM